MAERFVTFDITEVEEFMEFIDNEENSNTRRKTKNSQSRTTCSYCFSREIKNRNGLACNPDKTEEDHLCSCFQSITLPGID